MIRRFLLLLCVAVVAALPAYSQQQASSSQEKVTPAQEKALPSGEAIAPTTEKAVALVVHLFSVRSNVQWPYDVKQLQAATVVELKAKCSARADILADAPENRARVLTLDGEILSWKPGNRATRLLIGMGSGRETAEIHFWLTDASGKKVYEHTDTIRQSVWGGGYTPSVGELLQPFANKIANRLSESKAF